MNPYLFRNLLLAVTSLACLVFAGTVAYTLLWSGKPADIPIGGPFELIDHRGVAVTEKSFAGRYMMVYFGYTYCPDICPTELARMTNALDMFTQISPERAAKVVPIFISVDPARDIPALLREYRKSFHPRLVALTGSMAQIRNVADAYKVYFAKVPPEERDSPGQDYLIDHSSYIFLMGPNGRYITQYTTGASAEQITRSLAERVE